MNEKHTQPPKPINISFNIPPALLALNKTYDNFVSIEVPPNTLTIDQAKEAGRLVEQRILSADLSQLEGGYEKLYYLLIANQFELQLLSQHIAKLQETIVKIHNELYRPQLSNNSPA